MAGAGEDVIYLTKVQILELHRKMVLRHGGFFVMNSDNLINSNSFGYLLEAVRSDVHGQCLYSTVLEKAAAYAFFIIKDHVFYDGNKRTGLESAMAFLDLNGYYLRGESISRKELVGLGLSIANRTISFEGVVDWLRTNASAD